MALTHEQIGARVDLLGERMEQLERRVERIEANMATKGDIERVLAAVSKIETSTAPAVEVVSTTKSIGKFVVWAGTIVATVFGAIVAFREWVMR